MEKYNNKKITVDGETFDSRKEFYRYRELLLLERAGKISGLQRQVRYELVPPQYESVERYSQKTGRRLQDGKKRIEPGVYYIADFVYTLKDGATVVEDTKGFRTDAYIIKRKLMLHVHGIKILET